MLHLEWEVSAGTRHAWIDPSAVTAITEDAVWTTIHLPGSTFLVALPAAEVVTAVEAARPAPQYSIDLNPEEVEKMKEVFNKQRAGHIRKDAP